MLVVFPNRITTPKISMRPEMLSVDFSLIHYKPMLLHALIERSCQRWRFNSFSPHSFVCLTKVLFRFSWFEARTITCDWSAVIELTLFRFLWASFIQTPTLLLGHEVKWPHPIKKGFYSPICMLAQLSHGTNHMQTGIFHDLRMMNWWLQNSTLKYTHI